ELAPRVRVNAISPGIVPTEMSGTLLDQRIPPLGRLGTTADIASAAVFLASDQSSWMTGCVIPVDGGASVYHFHRGPRTPPPRPAAFTSQPLAACPPSPGIVAPVTKADRGDNSHAATSATSSGCPIRPIGTDSLMCCSTAGFAAMARATMSVAIGPGAMALIR